jgi:hypothetical protein
VALSFFRERPGEILLAGRLLPVELVSPEKLAEGPSDPSAA